MPTKPISSVCTFGRAWPHLREHAIAVDAGSEVGVRSMFGQLWRRGPSFHELVAFYFEIGRQIIMILRLPPEAVRYGSHLALYDYSSRVSVPSHTSLLLPDCSANDCRPKCRFYSGRVNPNRMH